MHDLVENDTPHLFLLSFRDMAPGVNVGELEGLPICSLRSTSLHVTKLLNALT